MGSSKLHSDLALSDNDNAVAVIQDASIFQAVFERADCAIIVFDCNGVILRVNSACERITGYATEDLVGRQYMATMIPKDLIDEAYSKLQKINETKESIHCESRWKRKDGTECILSGSFSVVLDDQGAIVRIIGIGVDVTSERAAQSDLRRSQERFELAVKGAQDGIWDVDVLTGARFYSARWKEIIGYADDELPNTRETWMNRIHPDDSEAVRRYQEGYSKNPDECHEVEFRMRHKDGRWIWIASRGRAVFDSNGKAVRIAGSHTDITKRKEAENELLESQARLSEAQDIANLGTWELDYKTGNIWWSPQTYRIYGIEPSLPPPSMEALLETVHPDDRERVRASIEAVTETMGPYRVKRRIYRPNGELRHVVTTARILLNPDGARDRVVGVVQDVTEQQMAEDAITKAREQAVEASRLKSEFLANMSHEIRTPMNGVIGMAEMLLDSNLEQEQRKCVQTIRTSADGLMTILNDILDFSKIEAGKLVLEDADVDVLEVVEEVATIMARSAQEKGLLLNIDTDWSSPAIYSGDSTRIRQILMNLASNAVKFTTHGSVTLGLKTSSDGVQLWVEDTGMGIAEERHRSIFDSFTQADGSITRRYGGTGLGLAIVRQLVDLMKGSVALYSQPNAGSRFDVFLPLESRQHLHTASDLKIPRVIAVSTNKLTQARLLSFFRAMSSQVWVVDGTEAAAQLIEPNVPISIVVDDHSVEQAEKDRLQVAANGNEVNLILLTHAGMSPPLGFDGTLNLPLTRRAVQQVMTPSTQTVDAESQIVVQVFAGMNVLLAEDNEVNQAVAEHQLERLGFHIDSVTNGKDAVVKATAFPYDLILMDVQMPELDGLTATGQIRRSLAHPRQPIILAMTAHAMQGDRERCIDAGMDDYISKPVRPHELYEKLMMWLKPESRQASKINWDYLHETSADDPKFEREILTVYIHSLKPLMHELAAAIRSQSHANVNRLTHTMKGSSRSIGANQFADLCQEVESLSESGQPYCHVDRLERHFEELVAECRKFIEC